MLQQMDHLHGFARSRQLSSYARELCPGGPSCLLDAGVAGQILEPHADREGVLCWILRQAGALPRQHDRAPEQLRRLAVKRRLFADPDPPTHTPSYPGRVFFLCRRALYACHPNVRETSEAEGDTCEPYVGVLLVSAGHPCSADGAPSTASGGLEQVDGPGASAHRVGQRSGLWRSAGKQLTQKSIGQRGRTENCISDKA